MKERIIGTISEEDMKAAVLNVVEHGKTIRSVASTFGIVHMSLQAYVNKYKSVSEDNKSNFRFSPSYVVNQILSKGLEDIL